MFLPREYNMPQTLQILTNTLHCSSYPEEDIGNIILCIEESVKKLDLDKSVISSAEELLHIIEAQKRDDARRNAPKNILYAELREKEKEIHDMSDLYIHFEEFIGQIEKIEKAEKEELEEKRAEMSAEKLSEERNER